MGPWWQAASQQLSTLLGPSLQKVCMYKIMCKLDSKCKKIQNDLLLTLPSTVFQVHMSVSFKGTVHPQMWLLGGGGCSFWNGTAYVCKPIKTERQVLIGLPLDLAARQLSKIPPSKDMHTHIQRCQHTQIVNSALHWPCINTVTSGVKTLSFLAFHIRAGLWISIMIDREKALLIG